MRLRLARLVVVSHYWLCPGLAVCLPCAPGYLSSLSAGDAAFQEGLAQMNPSER